MIGLIQCLQMAQLKIWAKKLTLHIPSKIEKEKKMSTYKTICLKGTNEERKYKAFLKEALAQKKKIAAKKIRIISNQKNSSSRNK